ncbi:MAG: tetraacyldisaccharide 4'-kinase [Burkholderiales bacterium]
MHRLQYYWYRLSFLHALLLPLALLFALGTGVRRWLYLLRILPGIRLPVPVIIIGNITAGGTGKTPLVIWLVDFLQQQGYRPGVISRGYGGSARTAQAVTPDRDAFIAGDEPVLLARLCSCPVWIGRDRVAAARGLLAAHPECNVLISDDGLQHYRLRRDVEIAVVDGERVFGNGLPLPAGPLREMPWRLDRVDAVVINQDSETETRITEKPYSFPMRLRGDTFYNLLNPAHTVSAAEMRGKKLHALAGIGNPQRFFRHLQTLGLSVEAHAFPDHHRYQAGDLRWPGAEAILMTGKDAVKCEQLADENCWALKIEAQLPPKFGERVLNKLKARYGSQTA